MANDILEQAALNGDDIAEGGGESHSHGVLHHLGSILKGAASLPRSIYEGVKGVGQYAYDSANGERNSVPYGVRAAVAGASTPGDKLRTLRQFYPDAMPDGNGDFSFFDPVAKKQMTLNDPGLSSGDLVNAIPSIGEGLGMAFGGTRGAAIGSVGGPVGAFGGAIIGGGAGGVSGKEIGMTAAQKLGNLLTNKDAIDTRTPEEISSDRKSTALIDGTFGGVSKVIPWIKNAIASKYLTPNSSALYDTLSSQGYSPSLSQVGSPLGKAVEEKFLAQGSSVPTKRAVANEALLNKNKSAFLGDAADADRNNLANDFRQGQQANVGGLKSSASQLYEKFPFSDSAIPQAEQSKGLIADIIQNQKAGNPAYSFDNQINYGIKRVASGKATEAELDGLQKDIGTYLRSQTTYDTTSKTLQNLQGALRNDLVVGAPGTSEEQQAARQGWAAYRQAQDKSQNLFGKQAGVSDGIDPTEGLTEGQSLGRAQKVFSSGPMGSDQKAAEIGSILNPEEKKTVLASLLNGKSQGFTNPIEQGSKDYNMARVQQYLTNPEDAQKLGDLLAQSQGTSTLANMKPSTDSLFFSTAQAFNPQKLAMRSALKSAAQGNVPGNLSYGNPIQNPIINGMPLLAPAIRDANKIQQAYQIPRALLEQGQPQRPGLSAPTDLNSLLAKQPQYSVKLDDYLAPAPNRAGEPQATDYQGKPMDRNIYQKPGQLPPPGNPSSLGYQPLNNFNKPASEEDLQNFINSQNKPKPQVASEEDLQNFINSQNPKGTSQGGSQDVVQNALNEMQNKPQDPRIQKYRQQAAEIANEKIPAVGAALLKTLSGPGLEGADYNTIVGGGKFNDFSDHPRQVGIVTSAGPSTAAGRHQITATTWDDLNSRHNYPDFSPQSQDQAAWDLAKERYAHSGRDIEDDLNTKNPDAIAHVAHVLSSTWTSLPGGSQQGSGAGGFVNNYLQNLNDKPATDGDLLKFIGNNPTPEAPANNDIPTGSVNLNDYL
jgi:muramidase (phage lysozyme)